MTFFKVVFLFITLRPDRDWFNPPSSPLQLLATELVVEKQRRLHAEERLKAAETARRAAERERDMFRVRWFSMLVQYLMLIYMGLLQGVMMRMSKRSQLTPMAGGHYIDEDEEVEVEVEEVSDDDDEEDEVEVWIENIFILVCVCLLLRC